MPGGYLRTNFRRTGGNQLTALGGGYALTSYAGGAGLQLPFGGLIMGSVTDSTALSTHFGISTFGAMSMWYGSGLYPAGYAMKIIAFIQKYNDASINRGFYPSVSGSIVYVYAAASTTLCTSSYSASFEYIALITSSP